MEALKAWWKRLFSSAPSEPDDEEMMAEEETLTAAPHPPRVEEAEEEETILETIPLPTQQTATAALRQGNWRTLSSGVFLAGWRSDVGKVRQHNEDGLFVFIAEQESDHPLMPFGLFILADGMGGHQAGEVASAVATRVVGGHLLQQAYLPILLGRDRSAGQPSLTEMMRQAIAAANAEVGLVAPGSGTTLTCAMIIGERLIIGHVGDSRAYLRHTAQEGKPRQLLTRDHSLVHKLVEIGQLTEEEAAVHPQRNMLYRAVGQGEALDVDVMSYPLQAGDQILLCSDGLWGEIPEGQIWEIVDRAITPSDACVQLTKAANEAGGDDNITVILVEFNP